MSQVTATVEQATRWVAAGPAPAHAWNPVYRALVEDAAPGEERAPDVQSLDLVLRQLTAPALVVMAVTREDTTRRVRVGLHASSATVERADGHGPSLWKEIAVQDVPSAVTALLDSSGVPAAPPRMTIRRKADGLRLTAEQNRTARAALARGLSAEDAYAAIGDLDLRLRDALTATGPRIALSLTLHDPQGHVTEQPVSWSRLWATGERGLYRLDAPSPPDGAIHAVDHGDVLGTVLPVLEEGLRFAAARSAGDPR